MDRITIRSVKRGHSIEGSSTRITPILPQARLKELKDRNVTNHNSARGIQQRKNDLGTGVAAKNSIPFWRVSMYQLRDTGRLGFWRASIRVLPTDPALTHPRG